jgi:hypothetical protein
MLNGVSLSIRSLAGWLAFFQKYFLLHAFAYVDTFIQIDERYSSSDIHER